MHAATGIAREAGRSARGAAAPLAEIRGFPAVRGDHVLLLNLIDPSVELIDPSVEPGRRFPAAVACRLGQASTRRLLEGAATPSGVGHDLWTTSDAAPRDSAH